MVSIVLLLYLGIRMLFSITAIHLQKKTIENVKNNTNSLNLLKLTTEQIVMFLIMCLSDIKWYELQVELTDHMVTSMEEFWEKS
jgi:hypothetical protein